MNLLDLMVKIGVDDEASGKIAGIAGNVKSGLSNAAKVGAAAMAAVSAAAVGGAVAIGKQALDAYASYEQLAGGVEKLFGDASETVMRNAQAAYLTAGMSANQYMEQATSFSASLVSSVGGDVNRAAELTDVAMRAMSDNVNVFGSNMGDVQNAFQGFAKQNYTMLDNLKLGYGGTQEEMQRLIHDASLMTEEQEKLNLTVEDGNMSFDNIVSAIAVMQENMGIAGTTSEEAMKTIEGSINATKAAWTNLLTEMGKEDGDIPARMEELVSSATAVVTNVTPVVQRISQALVEAAPELIPAGMELAGAIFQGIRDGLSTLFAEGGALEDFSWIEDILTSIEDFFTAFAETADFDAMAESLGNLASSIAEVLFPEDASFDGAAAGKTAGEMFNDLAAAIEEATPTIVAVVQAIRDEFEKLGTALTAVVDSISFCIEHFQRMQEALQPLTDFMSGTMLPIIAEILEVFPSIGVAFGVVSDDAEDSSTRVNTAMSTIVTVMQTVSDAMVGFAELVGNTPSRIQGGIQTVTNLFTSLRETVTNAVENMRNAVSNKIDEIVGFFQALPGRATAAISSFGTDMWNAGWNILQSFADGISAGFDSAVAAVESGLDYIRSFLPFSPAKRGPFSGKGWTYFSGLSLAEGFEQGLKRGFDSASMDMSAMLQPIAATAPTGGMLQAATAGTTYNIYVTTTAEEDVALRIRNELHAFNILNGR